jgi:hypothetical protein
LTPAGRLRLVRCVVEDGWPVRRAAERSQVSVSTAVRWAGRYREHGETGLTDRSSRPHASPNQLPVKTERRIIKVRVIRRWGPARIAYLLGLSPSTVHRVLVRYRCARLAHLDRATARPVRRYEHDGPGDLVHVDIKKLGNIPDGGGHRVTGRAVGLQNDEAWVFVLKTAGRMRVGRSVTLTRLGTELGQEDRHVIDFAADIWSAVWLSDRRFFLGGDGHFGIVDLDRTISAPIDDRLVSPHPGQIGAIRINEQTVLTASRHGTLYGIQTETGEAALLARFGRTLRSRDLTTTDGTSAYSLGLTDSGLQGYYPTIVRLSA